MTPGRSLSGNAIRRSCAPVARTICLARISQSPLADAVRRAACGRWSATRSTAPADVVVVKAEHVVRGIKRTSGRASSAGSVSRRQPSSSGSSSKPAAEVEILLRQDDASAGRPGCACRGKAGRARTDHQHIAVRMGVFVVIRVGAPAARPEPRGAADQGLIDLLPKSGRPHEGLVVEAGREEGGEQPVDRQQIEA